MTAAIRLPSPPQDPSDEPAGQAVHFPGGLLGFPEAKHYRLEAADVPGFFWLRSEEHSPLAFVLVDPFQVIEGYSVDVPNQEAEALGVTEPDQVAVLVIATVPREAGEMWTANLQGPVALNLSRSLGVQFVRSEAPGVRTPFRPALTGA